jgi:hypothetical protein
VRCQCLGYLLDASANAGFFIQAWHHHREFDLLSLGEIAWWSASHTLAKR